MLATPCLYRPFCIFERCLKSIIKTLELLLESQPLYELNYIQPFYLPNNQLPGVIPLKRLTNKNLHRQIACSQRVHVLA
jgi:hypothetical protein